MDVHCSTCNEPWDVYHLQHDAIFETDLSPEEARAWCKLPTSKQLAPNFREKFKALGWEFSRSILNVIHCPACPPGAKPHPERLATKRALEELFGDDQDGLASTFEDYSL
jgi:hypothetical protein